MMAESRHLATTTDRAARLLQECAKVHVVVQVPMDQPKVALDMITRFTRGEDFGARASARLVAASVQERSSAAAA